MSLAMTVASQLPKERAPQDKSPKTNQLDKDSKRPHKNSKKNWPRKKAMKKVGLPQSQT